MPAALLARITSGLQLGETIRRPPAAATAATSGTVNTVPAPISACDAEGLSHRGDGCDRLGRVQRHLNPGDPCGDQRLGHGDGFGWGDAAQDGDQGAGHGLTFCKAPRAAARPARVQAVASRVSDTAPLRHQGCGVAARTALRPRSGRCVGPANRVWRRQVPIRSAGPTGATRAAAGDSAVQQTFGAQCEQTCGNLFGPLHRIGQTLLRRLLHRCPRLPCRGAGPIVATAGRTSHRS